MARIGGRTGLLWCSSFVVLASGPHGIAAAAALAVIPAAVWTSLCQWTFGAARVKRVAFGSLATTAVAAAAGLVLLSAATFHVPQLGFRPGRLAVAAVAALVVVSIWERAADRLVRLRPRVLIVGGDPSASELIDAIGGTRRASFVVVGVLGDATASGRRDDGLLHGDIDDLVAVVRREKPDLVVVAADERRPAVFARLLEVADESFCIVSVPELYEQAFGRVPIDQLTASWFMSVLHLYRRPYSAALKRTVDLAIAATAIVALAPLFLLIALLVRLTPGPVIYRQARVGERGRIFTIYKFRTMRVDAEVHGARWAAEHDSRVTPIGRVLRDTRLDEIPQFWNVVKGDLSIVGPRPERPEFLQQLNDSVPYWSSRELVKPGITGWAQVNGGYAADIAGCERKLSYDLWYLRHRSLAVDLLVCVRTISKLSGSAGR